MNTEEKYIAKIIAITVCVALLSFSSCTATISVNDNAAMVTMVKSGADPIRAKCAIKGTDEKGVCILMASK